MTIERYVEQVPQSSDAVPVQLPLERGPGNFLLLQTSTALVTVTLIYDGVREVFANVNGGIYIRRIRPWNNLRIDGAIGTSVTYFIGTEVNDKDETDIRLQVATLAGTAQTADAPAATLADTPAKVCLAATVAALLPINLARRRVTFFGDPGNSATVYFRLKGGANRVGFVAPGAVVEIRGTFGIDYDNGSAANQTVYISEES